MAASPSVCAVGNVEDVGFLTVDMERHVVRERDDGQGARTRVEFSVVQHAFADVVVGDDNGARFSQGLVRADMVAVHVCIDDEVDRAAGKLLGLFDNGSPRWRSESSIITT